MRLEEYLRVVRWSINTFAEMVNIHPNTIQNLMKGKDVKWSTIIKIVDFTKGKVSYKDLRPEPEKKKKKDD